MIFHQDRIPSRNFPDLATIFRSPRQIFTKELTPRIEPRPAFVIITDPNRPVRFYLPDFSLPPPPKQSVRVNKRLLISGPDKERRRAGSGGRPADKCNLITGPRASVTRKVLMRKWPGLKSCEGGPNGRGPKQYTYGLLACFRSPLRVNNGSWAFVMIGRLFGPVLFLLR